MAKALDVSASEVVYLPRYEINEWKFELYKDTCVAVFVSY